MKNIIYFFLFFCFAARAQNNTLVQIWTNQNGNQSGSFKNFTVQDKLGATYVAGAHKNNTTTHDGYISKLSAQGQTIWTYNFTGTGNGDDVVLSVKFDNQKNIYLTGTTYKNTTNNYDLFLVKLDKDGNQLWYVTYNGTASSMDSGGDIELDTLGNIFVVGASMNSGSFVDFVVLKYDSIGNQVWENQYDYAGFNDAANKVILLGDSIYVSGVSQSAANNWDFTTISISTLNGNIGNEARSGGSGNGIDKLNAITYDNSGHIYITGAVLNANNNYDARTIKLNQNLSIVWINDYNGIDSLDDESNDVKVDSIGNVYIAGYSTKIGESKNILLIKYNSLGNTIFTKLQNGLGNGHDQANAVCLGLDGSIFITGSSKNTHEDIVTIKFNPTGLPIKTQIYSGSGNGKANSISVSELGEIIISGQVFENGDYKNVTINYLENIILPDVSNNQILSSGPLKYVDGLLHVRFHPACFNMDIMDNKEIYNQSFGVIMKDTVLKILTKKIYGNLDSENLQALAKMPVNKPFYFLDSNDTISIARNASFVKVPQFWASLILYLPPGLKLKNTCDSLDNCWPLVRFYDVVPIPELHSVTNDLYYETKQKSLHNDPNYPDADMNIEEAWDIETGKKFIKVGVNDTQADTSHADLMWAGHFNICNPTTTIVNQFEHGTAVGGIIGAKRNNNIGIAGIAGGNGNDSTGVSMYNLNVIEAFSTDVRYDFAIGLVLGSTQLADPNALATQFPSYNEYFLVSDTGLGLHIMNHSYGLNYGSFIPVDPNETYIGVCNICQEAIEYSYRNGVINVASRGNEFQGGTDAATDSIFPSCVKDEMVISVTASGYNGLFKTYDNNDPDSSSFENYMSMYARNVDLMAPGTTANVYSTDVAPFSDQYTPFNGTSASAPHVTGTAALMLSHVNQPCPCEKNLSPEDVESILQKTANERNSVILDGNFISTPNYDKYNGWGMLDASSALKAVEEPKNQIIHMTKQNANVNSVLVAQNAAIHLFNPYTTYATGYQGTFSNMFDVNQLYNGDISLQLNPSIDKSYIVDIYKVSTTIDHSSKTQHFSSSAILKDYWIRNSNSIGWSLDSCIHVGGVLVCDSIDVSQNIYFDTNGVDLNSASLFTYVYNIKRIIQDWDSLTYMSDLWYPSKPEGTEFAYSLYVYDSLATSVPNYPCTFPSGVKNITKDNIDNISLYPNPSSGEINLIIEISNEENILIEIFDIMGRRIQKMNKSEMAKGKHYLNFDIRTYNQGVYFIKVSTDDKIIANKKFIKL
ncbi:MAG: S8 family serine peptidase [Chitinophagales bacterium]|nr:S8 family serine peptidase [Chitinophagales bacterium]